MFHGAPEGTQFPQGNVPALLLAVALIIFAAWFVQQNPLQEPSDQDAEAPAEISTDPSN